MSSSTRSSYISSNGSESTEDVHAQLRALHSDELVMISFPTVLGTFYNWVKVYLKFLWMIWKQVFVTGDSDTDSFEWTTIFALLTTALLFPMLGFCLVLSIPGVQEVAFKLYAYAVTTPMYEAWWRDDNTRAIEASRAALCKSVEASGSGTNHQHFDLDIARLLLQFAGLVYEHDGSAVRNALAVIKYSTPLKIFGDLRGRGRVGLDKFIGNEAALLARAALTGEQFVSGALGRVSLLPPDKNSGPDGTIRKHLASSGIEYEPVSELNGVGSAFASLFWHPQDSWIVVAFKGTSPTEFDEWVTDLTFTREDIGMHIPGFGKVHSGFKARMFPEEARSPRSLGEHFAKHAAGIKEWLWPRPEIERKREKLSVRMPYDTIREGIQIVADHLTKNTGIHSINVYFTGHSLGCATASLAYARAVGQQNMDFKSNVRIRDAYLFAAPVIGDVKTRDAFNRMMGTGLPRTMWRITNGPDAVAAMLPEMGDRVPLSCHHESPLAFAHLGLEVKMAPTGPDDRGPALVEAVIAPHRPTWMPVRLIQAAVYGPQEEVAGRDKTTSDRDSGVFTAETASEHSGPTQHAITTSRKIGLEVVKKIPFGIGYLLWLGTSHIVSCYWVSALDFYCVEDGQNAMGSGSSMAGAGVADVLSWLLIGYDADDGV